MCDGRPRLGEQSLDLEDQQGLEDHPITAVGFIQKPLSKWDDFIQGERFLYHTFWKAGKSSTQVGAGWEGRCDRSQEGK